MKVAKKKRRWLVLHLLAGLGAIFGCLLLGVGVVALYDKATTPPKLHPLEAVFGKCGNPCIITGSSGGNGFLFMEAAASLTEGSGVIIDGPCNSSCAMFADRARPYVCVTEQAVFVFHQGYADTDRGMVPFPLAPSHSRSIALWAYRRGGIPDTYIGEDPLVMEYPATAEFWPVCGKHDSHTNTATALPKEDRLLPRPKRN